MLDTVGPADGLLAVVAPGGLAVEESPECGTVEIQVFTAVNVLSKTHTAPLIVTGAPREIRVAKSGHSPPRTGSVLPGADPLPVSGLGLLHSCIEVFGVMEVVVEEGVMLKGGAGEPSALGSFYECASSGGNVLMAASLKGVVGRPTPHIFNVTGRCWSEMKHGKSSEAVCRVRARTCLVNICICGAADGYMAVPQPNIAVCSASQIYLKYNGTGGNICYCKAHVLDLGGAPFSRISYPYNRSRIVSITKAATNA